MRESRWVTILFLLAGLLVPPMRAVWAAPAGLPSELRARNAELGRLRERIAAARARVGPAGAWADPRLSVELMDVPTMAGPKVALTQMVPLRAQPALMARMAELEVEMAEAEFAEREQMLAAEAWGALFELSRVELTEGVLKRSQDLASRMARVSEAKYSVGKGMQTDILRAHVARTKLFEPRIGLAAKRKEARATFEALLPGVAPTRPILDLPPTLPELSDLMARAERRSPLLRMRRLAMAHAELGVELARRERVPDLELGIAAGRQMPGDMPYLSAMAAMSLPLFQDRKQLARVTLAERGLGAATADLEAARRSLAARLATAHAQAAAADEQLRLYRGGLLVQARQTFQSSLAAYQASQGDFLMVLDAQMALYDLEMNEAMALAERLKMEVMLEALAGVPPDEWRLP